MIVVNIIDLNYFSIKYEANDTTVSSLLQQRQQESRI